ncbi:MAG: chemotaxis protein CheD [Firmicutes bacterium]|nr:chemotaxis protein CheD [Bacillota bacterium]MBO8127488.1 chemotaxis protein CheD [Bacillota bacterium]
MAQTEVVRAPGILVTYGLGSCVGVAAWDPRTKVGGLAHVMLPDSTQSKDSSNVAKFADTAMPDLINRMERLGALRRRLVIKIAGGAQMFSLFKDDRFSIGLRNVEAVKRALAQMDLQVAVEDTGGTYGRTLYFDTDTGEVRIRTIDHGEKTI